MTNRSRNFLRAALAAAIFTTTAFSATVIDLGTNNAGNWSITGAGAIGVTATAVIGGGGTIAFTDNSKQDGVYIAGASTGAFSGFWYADFMFILPGDAINVALTFSNLAGDDRVVLQLNGVDVGNEAVDGPGLGLMDLGAGDNLYGFSVGADAGIVNSGFNVGGLNTLRLVVNNSGTGRTGSTQSFATLGDATAAGVVGSVAFDTAIPEPGSISLILLGMAPLAWRFRRRRSS